MLRRYAQVVSVGLFLLGGTCMLGVGTTSPIVDLDHLFVGALLAYAGFWDRDEKFIRTMVGGLGVLYLLAGLLAFVVPALFGIFSDRPNGILLNHLVHLVLGFSNVVAAVFLGQRVGGASEAPGKMSPSPWSSAHPPRNLRQACRHRSSNEE